MLPRLSRIWGGRAMLEENERSATPTALKVNRKMQAGLMELSRHCTGSPAQPQQTDRVTARVLIFNCTSIDVGLQLRPGHGMHWAQQHGPSKIQLLHGFQAGQALQHQAGRFKHHHLPTCPFCLSYSPINTQNNSHHNVRKETGRRPGTASSETAECGHESRSHPPGRVGERCTHPDGMFNHFGEH